MRLLSALIAAALVSSTAGCKMSHSPECTDSEVKDLVVEIASREIVSQLFKVELFRGLSSYAAGVLATIPVETWKHNPPEPRDVARNFSFEVKGIQDIISRVEARVSGLEPRLVAIRVISREDAYKRVSCGASLTFNNGKDLNITYTAQTTEENDIYVEVEGL